MNTLEFLTKILPPDGIYYGVALPNAGGAPRHKAFSTLSELDGWVKRIVKNPDFQIYHACAAYKEPHIETGGKKQFRVADNQLTAKAFWVDLDVGEDKAASGKGYIDKKSAVHSIIKASRTFFPDLAEPLLVSSGRGVHAYWPLKDPITPDVWVSTAQKLKAALAHFGALADPSRTADFASILRPVGSFNRKGGAALEVRVIKNAEADIAAEDFDAALTAYLGTHELLSTLPPPPKTVVDANLNSDLTSHTFDRPPVWAETIANHCQQVALTRDTKGIVEYPHWFNTLGIIKHCEEGIDLAHDWSAGHPDYSPEKTQEKYDSWSTGPTTCAKFEQDNPGGCNGCKHAQGERPIRSPISLGQRITENAPINFVALQSKASIVVPPPLDGYVFHETPPSPTKKLGLYRKIKNDEDIVVEAPFSHTYFYARTRIRGENDKYSIAIRAHLPREGVKDFDIPANSLASAADLQKALADNQIVTTNNKDAAIHMQAYLKEWFEKLKHETDEQNTYQTFGWHDDHKNFLLGEQLYHHDGSVRQVLVGQSARSKVPDFPKPEGDLALWKDAIHSLYGGHNQQYRQFVIASCFASALVPLCSDARYRGISFSLYGASGLGKSTLVEAGLSAWGNDDRMSIKRTTGATLNARYLTLATYGNAPLLIDEVTNVLPDQLSDLCYGVSMGEEKQRLTVNKSAGVGFAETRRWATNLFLTSNSDLHAILKLHNNNSEAESVRMIQLDFDKEPRLVFDNQLLNEKVTQFKTNRGVAGEAFLKYVVTHKQEVKALMAKWADRIKNDFDEPQYRFYRNHAECAMAALEVCVRLEILDFDVESVYGYVLDRYRTLSNTITSSNKMTPDDALNRMLSSFTENFIVSQDLRDKRSLQPENLHRVVRDPVGRYIIGGPDNPKEAGRLYLSIQAIKTWCGQSRFGYQDVLDAAIAAGVWVELSDNRFHLGKGTTQVSGQTRVVCIDYAKYLGLHGIQGVLGKDGKITSNTIAKQPEDREPPEEKRLEVPL